MKVQGFSNVHIDCKSIFDFVQFLVILCMNLIQDWSVWRWQWLSFSKAAATDTVWKGLGGIDIKCKNVRHLTDGGNEELKVRRELE